MPWAPLPVGAPGRGPHLHRRRTARRLGRGGCLGRAPAAVLTPVWETHIILDSQSLCPQTNSPLSHAKIGPKSGLEPQKQNLAVAEKGLPVDSQYRTLGVDWEPWESQFPPLPTPPQPSPVTAAAPPVPRPVPRWHLTAE